MRLRPWHLVSIALVLALGSVSFIYVWITSAAEDPIEQIRILIVSPILSFGFIVKTWVFPTVLVVAPLLAWLRNRHKAFLFLTGAFGVLWCPLMGIHVFMTLVRQKYVRLTQGVIIWSNVVWLGCLLLAFSLLGYALLLAARHLSSKESAGHAASLHSRLRPRLYLWELLLVPLAAAPLFFLARLVIPTLKTNPTEYLWYNWHGLLAVPIYFSAAVFLIRTWQGQRSLGIFAFALAIGSQLASQLTYLAIGGGKVGNVSPDVFAYHLALPVGIAHSVVFPLVRDILFLAGIALLYREWSAGRPECFHSTSLLTE